MFEKVNPSHPDKVADRIAGAIVDYAYTIEENPRIAVEVLVGHGECYVIAESSVDIPYCIVDSIVGRIAGRPISTKLHVVPQDSHLSKNQENGIRCGDNGIFRGMPINSEEAALSAIAKAIYEEYPYDGKYIIDGKELIMCQSNAETKELMNWATENRLSEKFEICFNPLGYWTGGPDVDSGATNRKLGSDMGDAVTGGGLHGKDLSKADVSVNIYAHLKAQKTGEVVELSCAIGDDRIDGKPYSEIVEIARAYINEVGGFEKFAEWGLI